MNSVNNIKLHPILFFFFFAVFIPFIDVVRVVKIETSPLAGLLGGVIFLSFLIRKGIRKVNIPTFLSLILLFFLLIRIRPDYILDGEYLGFFFRTIISLLFGVFVFLVASTFGNKLRKKHVLFFVSLWLVTGVIQLSPLRGLFQPLLEFLMTRNAFAAETSRGINMLANEPSYAGIYLVLFLVLFDYLKSIGEKISKIYYVLVVLLMLLTFSSNALLLLISYLGVKYLLSNLDLRVKIFTLTITLSFLFLLTIIDINARSLMMLQKLLSEPSLLLLDQSLSSRFYFIVIAYDGLFESYFLGFGTGSYSINWMYLAEQLNIINDVPQAVEIQRAYSESRLLMPMTFLGGISHDLGLIGVLILFIMLFLPVYLSRSYRLPKQQIDFITVSTLVIFSLWLQTCSYSLPLPWFILGVNFCLLKNKSKNKMMEARI